VSSELVHIINRALEKDPHDRYQGMSEVLIDLRRLKKETTGVPFEEYPTKRRRFIEKKWIVFIASALVLAAAAIILFVVPRPRAMPWINPNSTTRPIPMSV